MYKEAATENGIFSTTGLHTCNYYEQQCVHICASLCMCAYVCTCVCLCVCIHACQMESWVCSFSALECQLHHLENTEIVLTFLRQSNKKKKVKLRKRKKKSIHL